MKKIIFDTDVIIDFLRDHPKAVEFIEKIFENSICYISVITIAELFADVRGEKEHHQMSSFLDSFIIIPLDKEIAIQGGLYRNRYSKSHGVGIADALIAATAISTKSELITLNKKHYPMLSHIKIPYIKNEPK